MHMDASHQRQTQSLDNIVENPHSRRLLHDKTNSNNLFMRENNGTIVNGAGSSNNNAIGKEEEAIEK